MSSLKVGKYYIDFTQVIGKGSTGNVYKGKNLETNETLAIKAIQMSKVTGQVNKYLLQSQKKAVNTIKSPYVIKTFDILQFNDFCYIIMEYCGSGSLKEYISGKGKLSNLEAISIFKKILIGYIAISEALFIHRDLKTANILIRTFGDPIIIDFGYCQMMMAKRPLILYNVGTPSYMAPQVYYRSRYSQKSDVWSLGVILYEMLTGKTLDNGLDMHEYFRNMQKQGKPKIEIEGISQVAKEIFELALQVSPQKRGTCHKLKYIIDRSLIPEVQNQLNRVLSPKMGKNTEQVSSVKFIPTTKFNYEPIKTEDPEKTQNYRYTQTSKISEIQKSSRQIQTNLSLMRSPERSSWPAITSTVYSLTPNFPLQTPFKSTKYEGNVQKSQIINSEQNKIRTYSQFNSNIIQQSTIQRQRRQTQFQVPPKFPQQQFNSPPQRLILHSPQSMKTSLMNRIK